MDPWPTTWPSLSDLIAVVCKFHQHHFTANEQSFVAFSVNEKRDQYGCDMVILRSKSTSHSVFASMCDQMTSEQFALFLIEACKSPDIQSVLKDIVVPNLDDFKYKVSAEVHRQMLPLKQQLQQTDQEIIGIEETIVDQQIKLDDLEQHGRRAQQNWCSSLGRVRAVQGWPATAAQWHCCFVPTGKLKASTDRS